MYSLYADSCHDVCIEFLKWLLTRSYQPTRILPGRVPLNWLHICSKSKFLIFLRPSAYYLNIYPRAHISFYHIKLVINPFQCSLLTSKIGEQLCSVKSWTSGLPLKVHSHTHICIPLLQTKSTHSEVHKVLACCAIHTV